MNTAITLESIYEPIDHELSRVSDVILDILSSRNELTEDVVKYFFSAKGKLLRPALTYLGAHLLGRNSYDQNQLIRLGCAFEVFHSATLIHDDIIDSAHIRRNLETIHMKWSPQIAVLVGDFLHDQAIKTIFETEKNEIIRLFLNTAGQVCDGEIHELKERKNFHLSEEIYLDIIDKKTASLLACSLASGAILAGASLTQKRALENFGKYFGAAFQIVDDCLDLTGNQEEFGKTLGTDFEEGVLTLPFIYYFTVADKSETEGFKKMFDSGVNKEQLKELVAILHEEGAIQYSLKKAQEFSDRAKEELKHFNDNAAKKSLERLLDYVLERTK
jgi:octaprenyl-diphosphate synthase